LPEIGFLRQGSRALVDVPHCPIATPAINSRLERLRQEARDAAKAN
jgi:tRNA/tmRNA/rRNA uracil-C5-methylase (TrmA/RlmC/RlmD family)